MSRTAPGPRSAVHVVDRLDALRALADPLRLRILEALCGAPRTTKQVAELLGEKPTRLYHHVEALESAGLVRLQTTRPKRGTIEKYYQAVARQFRVDSRLLPGAEVVTPEADSVPANGDAGTEAPAWAEVVAGALENAAREARSWRDGGGGDGSVEVIAATLEIRGGAGTRTRVRERVEALLAELEAMDDAVGEPAEAVRLTIAALPAPRVGGRDTADDADQ